MLGTVMEACSSKGVSSPGGTLAARGGDLGGSCVILCSQSTGAAGQVFISKAKFPEALLGGV